jgi:hypothetical protein
MIPDYEPLWYQKNFLNNRRIFLMSRTLSHLIIADFG